MMQEIIVALIVAVAAWAVVKRYTPAPLKRACRSALARAARRFGWMAWEGKLSATATASASCADGCGSCGGCGPAPASSARQSAITPDTLRQTIRR